MTAAGYAWRTQEWLLQQVQGGQNCSLECKAPNRAIHKSRCAELEELGPHLAGHKMGKHARRVNLGERLHVGAPDSWRRSLQEVPVRTTPTVPVVCALCLAPTEGHAIVIDFLVQRGALVDNTAEGGFTALYLVCQYGQYMLCYGMEPRLIQQTTKVAVHHTSPQR